MASIGQVTVDIGLSISDDTVKQLLLFLNVWRAKNPDRRIEYLPQQGKYVIVDENGEVVD